MPRYYFHLISEGGATEDREGEDSDDDTAFQYACALARNLRRRGRSVMFESWAVEVTAAEQRRISLASVANSPQVC